MGHWNTKCDLERMTWGFCLSRNHKGLTLVEMTLVLGFMAFATVGVLTLTEYMNKSVQSSRKALEIAGIEQGLQLILSDPARCSQSITAERPTPHWDYSTDASVPVVFQYGGTRYAQGARMGTPPVYIASLRVVRPAPGSCPEQPSGNLQCPAQLEVRFSKEDPSAPQGQRSTVGATELSRTYPIEVTVSPFVAAAGSSPASGGQIQSCVGGVNLNPGSGASPSPSASVSPPPGGGPTGGVPTSNPSPQPTPSLSMDDVCRLWGGVMQTRGTQRVCQSQTTESVAISAESLNVLPNIDRNGSPAGGNPIRLMDPNGGSSGYADFTASPPTIGRALAPVRLPDRAQLLNLQCTGSHLGQSRPDPAIRVQLERVSLATGGSSMVTSVELLPNVSSPFSTTLTVTATSASIPISVGIVDQSQYAYRLRVQMRTASADTRFHGCTLTYQRVL